MPVNRRSFLASSITGGAALAWSHALPAADDLDEFSFVIVSDTHLGRQDSKTPEKNWRAAIDEINEAPGDVVLHLGDVVDSGKPEQYRIYEDLRKTLKKPIHEVPGNHDPVELFEKHVAAPIDRSFDHCGVRFVLFNNSRWGEHLGFITPEQVAWLAEQFDDAAEKNLKIVVGCHVPIHYNNPPDRAWYVQPSDGQKAFYETLERHLDRVIAVFHGHFHNGIRGWRDHGQVVESLCPSLCYNQNRNLELALIAGKATGFFVDELRVGYVLVTLGKGRLAMRYKPLGFEVHGEYTAEWS